MRIDSLFTGQPVTTTLNPAEILSRMKIGDVIRAQVLEITSNQLMLRLFDGTVFSASTEVKIDAKPGDTVELTVANKNGEQVILKNTPSGEEPKVVPGKDMHESLSSKGIKPDPQNIKIAESLKDYHLPIEKKLFTEIAGALKAYKSLTPERAAFLLANGIRLEEKSIASLSKLIDERARLSSMLEKVFQELEQVEDPVVRNSIVNAIKKSDVEAIMPKTMEPSSIPTSVASVKGLEEGLLQDPALKAIFGSEEQKAVWTQVVKSFPEGPELSADHMEKILTKEFPGFEKLAPSQKEQTLRMLDLVLHQSQAEDRKPRPTDVGPENRREEWMAKLQENPPERGVTDKYHKELKDFRQKLLVSVESENLKKDLNIGRTYKEVLESLDHIKADVSKAMGDRGDSLAARIESLQDTVRFIREINVHQAYIQIPLNINGQNTTGELYVMKRKQGRKKIDPHNSVLLIALDTASLGHVETLIKVEKQNISLNLRAENENILGFVKENYRLLYTALLAKGYKLVDMKYKLLGNETNVVNAEKEVFREALKKEKGVDYRI